jgi:hypothetical protein
MKGLEAFAFVEAYTAVQNEHALASNPVLAAALAAQKAQTHGPEPTQIEVTPHEPAPASAADAEAGTVVLDAAQPAPHPHDFVEHVFRDAPMGKVEEAPAAATESLA